MSMDGVEDELDRPARPTLVYPLGDPPPAGEAREIAPGVRWIRMPLPFALKWINLWLLEDGDGWTVVDTGVAMEESRGHWRAIFEANLAGRPVKRANRSAASSTFATAMTTSTKPIAVFGCASPRGCQTVCSV